MANFVVTRKSDGAEILRYVASQPLEDVGSRFPFSEFDHSEWDASAPPTPLTPHKITKLAFRSRLTDEEKQDIEVASIDVATATLANRKKAAALRVYMADLAVSEYIDLKDARLRNGVLKMEVLGLIAAGRAAEILDTPPTSEEVFSG